MPRPTERDVRLVRAYLVTGSWKGAACELGLSPVTVRHQAQRAFARHEVTNVAQLVLIVAPHLEGDTDIPLPEDERSPDD